MPGLLTIVGRIYVRAPVSSNMMTTTVTVILMIPLRTRQLSDLMRTSSLPESRSSAKKRVGPRCDARHIWLTYCKHARMFVVPVG